MRNNVAVVIPTYNEKSNITRMIDEINMLRLPIDILIVDDNSPDGTGETVELIKKNKTNLDIIHRDKKNGIGPAYIEAFQYLFNKGGYDYIVHMDADFSHNPKDIPRLLESAEEHDVVVGSRYIRGGGVSDRWSYVRKLLSKGGNVYARLITGLTINDCTGGFRCFNTKALQSVNLDEIFLNGYGFMVELLYRAKKNICVFVRRIIYK